MSLEIKYLGINLTEDMSNIYTENNKILLREHFQQPKYQDRLCL